MQTKTTTRRKPPRAAVFLLAAVYALFMIKLLFLRGSSGGTYFSYNLVPLRTINNYIEHYDHFNFDTWFKNLFGNIVLFIPIGIFGPLLHASWRRTIPFIAFVLLLLLAIAIRLRFLFILLVGVVSHFPSPFAAHDI
ncbi:MAG: VanZ family protein, partial [Paenibacillaceae bacterium]|nr:VanZ family protein [Paenibacillaceae bacterium]